MNSPINLNVNFNKYGIAHCESPHEALDSNTQIFVDALVKKVAEQVGINKVDLSKQFTISLHSEGSGRAKITFSTKDNRTIVVKSNPEILSLVNKIFRENPDSNSVVINHEESIKQNCLPLILNEHKYTSNQALEHIHADEFGKNSTLEGWQSLPAINYVINFLRNRVSQGRYPYGLSPQMVDQLRTTVYLFQTKDNEKKREEMYYCFRNGESVVVIGGWAGAPQGHAMLYEVIPDSDKKTCTLRIYNRGDGINQGHVFANQGGKTKASPLVEWQGISLDEIYSDRFLNIMSEMPNALNYPEDNQKNTNYNATDIYQALKEICKPTSIVYLIEHEGEPLFMTPQRAGVCSWASLMALMRTKMKKNEYKLFKCDLKIQSLIDHLNTSKLDNSLSEAGRYLLIKNSLEKLCRSIDSLYKKGVAGEEYVVKAHKHLLPIHQYLKSNKGVNQPRSVPFDQKDYQSPSLLDYSYTPNTQTSLIDQSQGLDATASSQPHENLREQFIDLDLKSHETISSALEHVFSTIESSWKAGNDLETHILLDEILQQLPGDEKFWIQACNDDPEKAKKLIAQVGKVQHLFFKTSLTLPDSHEALPSQILNILKLININNTLGSVITPLWNRVSISSFFYRNTYEDGCHNHQLYFHFFNENCEKELKKYASRLNHGEYRFSQYLVTSNKGSFYVYDECPYIKDIYDLLSEIDYLTIENIGKKDHDFQHLGKFQRSAHIYASDELPEWLKVIRNGIECFNYLSEGMIVKQDAINRETDLNFKYKIENPSISKTEVHVSLEGVPPSCEPANMTIQEIYKPKINPYPPFKSNKISKFAHALKFSSAVMEERFLITGKGLVENYHFSPKEVEEFKELAYSVLSPELCLPQTLEFFMLHPEYIFDTDYQQLFQMIFFQLGFLSTTLQNEGFEEKIQSFLNSCLNRSVEDNQIQTTVFLMRFGRYLKNYIKGSVYDSPTSLSMMLEQKKINNEQKSAIYSELIASLKDKQELDPQDIENMLLGLIHIKQHAVPREWTNRYLENEINESILKHANSLKAVLYVGKEPNHVLLNKILKTVNPDSVEGKWSVREREGFFPEFYSENEMYSFYPLIGKLTYPGVTAPIPHHIRDNRVFKNLFPSVLQATQLQAGVYSFKDAQGVETLIKDIGTDLIIEQKRGFPDASWFRYKTPDEFVRIVDMEESSNLLSMHFLQHHTIWESLDTSKPSILIVDPSTGENLYKVKAQATINNNFRINEIVRLSDGAKLGIPQARFRSFEHENYIHEWYINDRLVELEFPRYGLNFKNDNEELLSVQFPGYRLNIEGVLPKLGGYSHYLVLENEAGIKKAILPAHHFSPPKEKQEVYEPRYEIDLETSRKSSKPQKYHAYAVAEDGKLSTKSREGNLYLAEVLVLMQRFDQSAFYLKKFGPKLRLYSDEETTILQKIATMNEVTGREAGSGYGVQAYANYLLVKNMLDFPPPQNKISDEKKSALISLLSKNYHKYLAHLNNVKTIKFSKEEELFIIRTIPGSDLSIARKNKLLGQGVGSHKENKKNVSNLLEPLPLSVDAAPLDFSKINPGEISTPSQYFLQSGISNLYTRMFSIKSYINTTDIYVFIKKYVNQIPDRLIGGLIFLKANAKSPEDRLKVELLQLVAEHPERFPPLEFNSNVNIHNWWKDVVVAANQVSIDFPPKKMLTPPSLGPLPEPPTVGPEEGLIYPDQYFNSDYLPSSSFMPTWNLDNWFEQDNINVNNQEASKPSSSSLNEILNNLSDIQQNDPLVKKEVDRLREDFVALEKQDKIQHYKIKEGALDQLTDQISRLSTSERSLLEVFEQEILQVARQKPQTKFGQTRLTLKEWGGDNQPLKMSELIVNFAKQDPAYLQERNPALLPEDIKKLYTKISEYLLLATHRQQCQRILTAASTIENLKNDHNTTPEQLDEAVQKLASEVSSQRRYQANEKPSFLAFEYFADIMMRKNQTQMIESFLEEKDVNTVKELIMGSGKSKVLMPLLALLRADGKKVSMMIVPEPLFQSVSSDTQTILDEAFGKELKTFHFDRSTAFDKDTLENILEGLKDIRDQKKCLIMTSKSIQCLLLKFIEKSVDHFADLPASVMTPELKLMREIIELLSKESWPLLDEADLLLNAMHEVCFSIGKANPPYQQEIEVIADLYEIIYTDPVLKKMARVESDPDAFPDAPVFTESLYHEQMKTPLAKAFINKYKTKDAKDKLGFGVVEKFFLNLSERDESLLINYLCRTKGHEKEAQAYFDQQEVEVRRVLAMAGEEISNLLPHALSKPSNEKYGVDPDGISLLASPFSSANTPSKGSEFASPHVTMNFTFQHYIKNGIPKNILTSFINKLQESARLEVKESNGEKEVKDTEAWKIFSNIKGSEELPFFQQTDEQVDALLNIVNKNYSTRLSFISKLILPEIVIYDKKISSTSHNLASLFLHMSGFTGTLWNSNSMHRKIKTESAKGTDALTINKLLENSYAAVHVIDGGSTQEMLQQVQRLSIPFDLLADAGGYFKEGENQQIAQFAGKINQKSAVYYDKLGDQTLWDNEKNAAIPLSETSRKASQRVTFLDQSHTTGADVPQSPTAVGLVTIGSNMFLRDLLQSVWRLRGLDKGQRIVFVISKDVETIIRQTLKIKTQDPLTFGEILNFTIINQAKQQGKDNFKAFIQEMSEISQKMLLETLINPSSTPEECAKGVQNFGSSWIKDAHAPSEVLYGTIPVEAQSAVIRTNMAEAALAQLAEKGIKSEALTSEVSELSERYQDSLPLMVLIPAANAELTIEQEQQKVAEKQAELETQGEGVPPVRLAETIESEDLREMIIDDFNSDIIPEKIDFFSGQALPKDTASIPSDYTTPLIAIPIELFFSRDPALKDCCEAFEGINVSLNMLQVPSKKNIQISEIKLFGIARKHIRQMLINDDGSVTLINHLESCRRLNKKHKNLYNLHIGYLNSTNKLPPDVYEKIVKIKFLNGESNYSSEEVKILKEWISQNNVQKMYELFTKHILQEQIGKSQDYENSSLQRIFNQLRGVVA